MHYVAAPFKKLHSGDHSSAPIFLNSHYFRQNIWIPVSLLIYIWGLVKQLKKWIKFRDELNTNLETAHQYFRRWKKRQIFVSFKFHFFSTACSNLLVCRILSLDDLNSFFANRYHICMCFYFIPTHFVEKFIQTSRKLNQFCCTTFHFAATLNTNFAHLNQDLCIQDTFIRNLFI